MQTASRLSDPPNPLPEPKGTATDRDTVLLNGGFQPRFTMKVSQRLSGMADGWVGWVFVEHCCRCISLLYLCPC